MTCRRGGFDVDLIGKVGDYRMKDISCVGFSSSSFDQMSVPVKAIFLVQIFPFELGEELQPEKRTRTNFVQ